MSTMPPNVRIIIDALVSGEWPQTQETLQDSNGYCCLGVMAKLSEIHGGTEPNTHLDCGFLSGGYLGVQPDPVREWVGLKNSCGSSEEVIERSDDGTPITSLVGLNDDLKWSFEQIGEWLEDNWALVFKPE